VIAVRSSFAADTSFAKSAYLPQARRPLAWRVFAASADARSAFAAAFNDDGAPFVSGTSDHGGGHKVQNSFRRRITLDLPAPVSG
jgi:hypothetical protein